MKSTAEGNLQHQMLDALHFPVEQDPELLMSKTLVKSWDIFVVCVKMVNCMACTSTVFVIVFFQASIAVVCPHLPWVLFESLPLPSYFD